MYIVDGQAFTSIRSVAEAYGLPYTTLLHRLDNNIPLELAVKTKYITHKQVTVEGKTFTSFSAACKEYGVHMSTALNRHKKGWSIEQVFGLAPKPKQTRSASLIHKAHKKVVVRGESFPSYKRAAQAYDFSYQVFVNRLKKGLTPEQALELEPFPSWFVAGKGQFAVRQREFREAEELRTGKRKCTTCKELKPLTSFHKGLKGRHSFSFRCDSCTSKAFLRYRYGITAKEFQELVRKQNSMCAVCGVKLEIEPNGTKRTKNVAVDHCHTTGKVRGVLCKNCNVGLGFFQDSVSHLHKAIKYLEEHQV